MKKVWVVTIFILVTVLPGLSGCAFKQVAPTETPSAEDAAKFDQSLVAQLRAQGIKMITIGDQITFSIPTDLLFITDTPRLKVGAYPTLNTLIAAINHYEKISVKVSAYTNHSGSTTRDLALTEQQASALVYYLGRHGVAARILYPQGYGSTRSLTMRNTYFGKRAERHVEVSLVKLPVPENIDG